MMMAIAPDLVHFQRASGRRRPGPDRRTRLPLHRARAVPQRRHRPAVRGDAPDSAPSCCAGSCRPSPTGSSAGGPRSRRSASRLPRISLLMPVPAPPRPTLPNRTGEHMDTVAEVAAAHAELAERAEPPGRQVRHGRLDRRARPQQVEDRAGRPPAQAARRLGALHPARHGRHRRHDAARGRVRGHPRPVHPAGVPVGPPLRLDGRRPVLRRPRALRALPPLGP